MVRWRDGWREARPAPGLKTMRNYLKSSTAKGAASFLGMGGVPLATVRKPAAPDKNTRAQDVPNVLLIPSMS